MSKPFFTIIVTASLFAGCVAPDSETIRTPKPAPMPPAPSLTRSVQASARAETTTASAAAPGGKVVYLQFDPSPSPEVTGYRLYWATNGGTLNTADIGMSTTASIELPAGESYRFAVTAVGDGGVESGPSNEVLYYVPVGRRIERLVLEIFEALDGPKVGELVVGVYTNAMTGSTQKYLRLRQELMGVE